MKSYCDDCRYFKRLYERKGRTGPYTCCRSVSGDFGYCKVNGKAEFQYLFQEACEKFKTCALIVFTAQDQAELKRLQKKLREADKIESSEN